MAGADRLKKHGSHRSAYLKTWRQRHALLLKKQGISYLKAANLFLEVFLACKALLLIKFKVKASGCKQVRSI